MGRALIYGSVCSGVEAATVAWHSLGWQATVVQRNREIPISGV
jgi:pyruvate/2-oxoglutarate dehydrogenase complex dihydrolipoamide dehydrogenase (E3) component